MFIKDSAYRQIARIAASAVISNVSVPLLSLVDNAICGHMDDSSVLAAVTVGGSIFSMIYWLFAFLRMGTTGMVAQACGSSDRVLMDDILKKTLWISFVIGLCVILLRTPIFSFSLFLLSPPRQTLFPLSSYFNICIWGAPAVLMLYVQNGYFVGVGRTDRAMWVSLFQNLANIFLSLLLVYVFRMGMKGVALGTLLSVWLAYLLGLRLISPSWKELFRFTLPGTSRMRLSRFFSVNIFIFLRTICLISTTLFFTYAGGRNGANVLAANALLMQFFIFYSYLMDGFANAAESLSGRLYQPHMSMELKSLIRKFFRLSFAFALSFSLLYIFFGGWMINALTDIEEVRYCAHQYLPYVYFIPFAGLAAVVWDGFFIGLTMTKGMFFSLFVAACLYFTVYYTAAPFGGNHALWVAFLVYLAMRGVFQTVYYKYRRI